MVRLNLVGAIELKGKNGCERSNTARVTRGDVIAAHFGGCISLCEGEGVTCWRPAKDLHSYGTNHLSRDGDSKTLSSHFEAIDDAAHIGDLIIVHGGMDNGLAG
jgi:hypothetical protein